MVSAFVGLRIVYRQKLRIRNRRQKQCAPVEENYRLHKAPEYERASGGGCLTALRSTSSCPSVSAGIVVLKATLRFARHPRIVASWCHVGIPAALLSGPTP